MASSGNFSSAHDLIAGLRSGRLSSEALVTAALERIRDVSPTLNPMASLDAEAALAHAKAADVAARAGNFAGALHGLPMTVKDCFEVAGLPTINGAPALRDYRPPRHAAAVQRLVNAGVVVIGKTNVPLHSLDLQTFNDVFGVTRNPWNPDRTPGGSSGGAAVALATGITSLEIGTDLAGSLRNPAHSTGVCALKPSYGVVPTSGALSGPPGPMRIPDLMVAGPMARTVGDLRLLLDVMAGPIERESAAWTLRLPASRKPATALRIAAWLDEAVCPVEPDVANLLECVVREIEGAGVRVDRNARPEFDPTEYFRRFLDLMYGEMAAGFPESMYQVFATAARRNTVGAEWTPLSIMPGAVTQSHRDWLAACERRECYRLAWAKFFTLHDVLITPVSPASAFLHDHRPFEQRTITLRGREYPYMQQSFWCGLATASYLPAAAVPAGFDSSGMPVGVQIIAPYLGDYTALEFAELVERLTGGFQPPPQGHPPMRRDGS